ncbi:hypothetical protein A2693_00950 [Candidatus Curtissbacteria bacterium RIFCSPHIGHO2_01_FULL_40_12]|uniref:SGNH hydrolase-type esterase domain-containing protein n=2 Tax=Candidatus Curtissiibacteriota TaxID=1752717 RepID=A0A1F5GAV7_9BACT|nr:MAG: hypothetical protein A2693_00950 [Candidatus Curtissbacteria bacterium RIFCSPHIGHO2_01_FULL_40_12]
MFLKLWPHLSYFLSDFSLYLVVNFVLFCLSLFFIYKIFKSKASERKKKLLLSLVFVFFVLVLAFSVFEAYFRYVYDESDGLGYLKVNSKWHQRHVIYNAYFYRDRDFTVEKKEGVKRIGVIGDSIAFGGGIKNVNDRFSNLLEKKLKDSGYKVEVYDLGKPGYDTEGEIAEYQKVKNLDFDIIIWEYFLNDVQPQEKSTGTPIIARNSQTANFVQFFSDKSYFFDFIFWRLSTRYQKTFEQLKTADLAQYEDQNILNHHKLIIADFLKELNLENKKVVVIIFPLLAFLGPDYPAGEIHNQMANFFEDNGAEVIDLLDYLKDKNGRDLWASQFDSHPNEFVHRLAADKLFDKVKPLFR